MQFGIWNVSLCVCLKGRGEATSSHQWPLYPMVWTHSPFSFQLCDVWTPPPETHLFTSGSSSATEQASQGAITLPSWGKQTDSRSMPSADITLVQSRSVSQSLPTSSLGTHSGEDAFPTQVLTLDGSCLEETENGSLLWCLERLVHTPGLAAVCSTYHCLILIKAWQPLQDRGPQPLGPTPGPPVRSAAALDEK